jgi:uncharacterized protein YjdB
MLRTATALGGAGVALVLAACADGGTTIMTNSDAPTSLSITVQGELETPASLALAIGDDVALSATAVNAIGLAVSGVTATWSSSASSVVQVDQSGSVQAVGPGSATVSASASGISAFLPVDVSDTTTRP